MTTKQTTKPPKAPPRPPTLRDETKAMFRSAILETAERVFDEVGYHSARIQDIAERARIGVGTVYNHFAQKEDMLRALVDERAAEIEHAIRTRPDDPRAWEPKVRLRYHRLAAFIGSHRHFFRIMCDLGLFGACSSESMQLLGPRFVERHARKMREAVALMQEGVDAGMVVGEVAWLTRFLGGAMRNVLDDAVRTGAEDLEQQTDLVLDLFLRAAAPQPKSKGAR